ncbi:MAG: HAD family phosphatase [Lachnospiraceae bacterium]|nr:HAD family phosphatase [Lachnospiraceae bacterium]
MFDKSKYKAAAFDLDGTLLDKGKMSEGVKEALIKLKNSGIITIVATGRDWCQVEKDWRKYFTYCISTSGGCIRKCDTEEVVASHPIRQKDVLELIEVIDSFHSGYFLYLEGSAECTGNAFAVINKNMPRINREDFLNLFSTREHPEHSLYNFQKTTEKVVYKIESYYPSKEASLQAGEALKRIGKYETIVMSHDSVEINAKGINKAGALKELGEMAGFDAGSLVAFGDSSNDLDMLKYAGFAVVMDNGADSVKEVADLIAPDVSKDGAATTILELFELD